MLFSETYGTSYKASSQADSSIEVNKEDFLSPKLSKLCISQTQKGEELNFFVRKFQQFKAYLADEHNAEVWIIKDHEPRHGETAKETHLCCHTQGH